MRGLRIDRAGEDNVGLFAEISSGGGRVQDVGLENARVNGADIVGAIAGSLGDGGELRSVWVHGRVTGGSQVGGLAGSNVNSAITSSWFAGQVTGDEADLADVGGLAGTVSASNARMLDSWAAVDIVATMTHAGELAGEITDDALLEAFVGRGFLVYEFARQAASKQMFITTISAPSATTNSQAASRFGMSARPSIFRF